MPPPITLRRYTNLAATIHILRHRCLTLLNPETWDDKNDAFFVCEYQRRTGAQSVLALCFTQADETYHHWRIFSHGTDGICIEFDKKALIAIAKRTPGLRHGAVDYSTIEDARDTGIDMHDLPFLKRYPFRDEHEFRLLHVDKVVAQDYFAVPVTLDSIERITLSPWMAKPLADVVKETLRGIKGCSALKVYRSTLIDSERWKRVANAG